MGIQALPSLVNRSHRKDRPVRNGSTPPHSQKTHRSTARVPLWLMALGWFRRPERDLPHCLIDMLSELLEIVSEQANELPGSGAIFTALGQGLPRLETLDVDARHANRNLEPESFIHTEFVLVQVHTHRLWYQRQRTLHWITAT